MKKIALLLAIVLLAILVLFEINLDLQFSLPREVVELDAQQEMRYVHCVQVRDTEIHRVTFANIDNPDVQREYLSTEKDKAKATCRAEFPGIQTTSKEPFRFNVVDFKFRYSK
jgi:hypothetical protein